jgi:hypothetical protein
MKIEFTKNFETPEQLLGISRKDVISAVTNPIKKQSITIDKNLDYRFFLQKDRKRNTYNLVVGEVVDNKLFIDHNCFRLMPELVSSFANKEPIVLLQQLALNFGFPMTVGGHITKFIFRQSFIGPFNKKNAFLGAMPCKPGDHVVASMFSKFRTIEVNGQKMAQLDCAMVFFLEYNSYLDWVNKNSSIQISKQTYDVFIAYKKNTGKGFAKHLKDCLTQEGFRAFLDTVDIPKEFEGTEKWFTIRDEAIKNSKRFLLVITISIESSEEVAKELFLARSVPNIKLIYARHDELTSPEIQIALNDEIINLAEGNQMTFSSEDDLARQILKILVQDEKNLTV